MPIKKEAQARIKINKLLEKAFGIIDSFPKKEELLQEECEKFISIYKPESKYIPYIVNYIRSYITDQDFRKIIDKKEYTDLYNNPGFDMENFKALGDIGWQKKVPEYIKNYVNLNLFME